MPRRRLGRILTALSVCLAVGTACAPKPPPVARVAPACPPEMALVAYDGGRVCVDRYEAAVDGWHPSHPLDGVDTSGLKAIPAKGILPQVNISEVQAQAMCHAASKRLCTAAEWLAACRGPEHRTYPYGDHYEKGACNDARPSPVMAILGGTGGRLDDPRLAEVKHGMEPGGSFPACVSAYGIYDMHGNVHEWVSDGSHEGDPRFGEFLGGFYADAKLNGEGCTYKTTAHFKIYHDYSTGFRCCKDALAP